MMSDGCYDTLAETLFPLERFLHRRWTCHPTGACMPVTRAQLAASDSVSVDITQHSYDQLAQARCSSNDAGQLQLHLHTYTLIYLQNRLSDTTAIASQAAPTGTVDHTNGPLKLFYILRCKNPVMSGCQQNVRFSI